MRRIRVLLVDDHELVRMGLRVLLEREARIEIVGEAGTAEAAVSEALRLRPDIVLMDVRLADGSGVTACRTLRDEAPEIQVIMLTAYADEEASLAALTAGAAGYLLKQVQGQDVVRAIEAVANGHSLLDPAVTRTVAARLAGRTSASDDDPRLATLSAQESRVLELVAAGKTNKEIAATLSLSEKTVKNYLAHIFDKLDVARRAEAAARFARASRRR